MARQPVGDHPTQREDEGGNHDRGATYPTSATTPPSGKMRAGTMTAAATYPTSAAEPPIARTANGIATSATAVPVTEMALQASSSRKLRLRNGPGRTFMSRSLTSGTAGGPRFTDGVAATPEQPQAVTRGWAEAGAGRAARAVVPLPGGAGLT